MVFRYKKLKLYLQGFYEACNQGKYFMTENKTSTQPVPATSATKPPNEKGTIHVEGFVKIFDPNTKEKFVEKRA